MQELAREVKEFSEDQLSVEELQAVSVKWATYSLGLFRSKNLEKALEISRAISEFTAQFLDTEQDNG